MLSLLKSLVGSIPSHRRQPAFWSNQDVNDAAEVLEMRAVPAPLQLGLYMENNIQPPAFGDRVNVLTNSSRQQQGKFLFGTASPPSIAQFDVEIVGKNNGSARVKSVDDDVRGKLILKKQGEFEYSFKYKFKINGEILSKTGEMSGPFA